MLSFFNVDSVRDLLALARKDTASFDAEAAWGGFYIV